jgi:hypothetical protein
MLVLVADASDAVASSDPEGFEVDYLGGKRLDRVISGLWSLW